MFRTFKYTTKNLTCFYTGKSYNIYITNTNELIAVYYNQNNIKLSPKIPEDPTKYEYFDEMKEIISFIYDET